jgi:hypothetical protein
LRPKQVLSVLLFKDLESGNVIVGCVISQVQEWFFCHLVHISRTVLHDDTDGYTYFETVLTDEENNLPHRTVESGYCKVGFKQTKHIYRYIFGR